MIPEDMVPITTKSGLTILVTKKRYAAMQRVFSRDEAEEFLARYPVPNFWDNDLEYDHFGKY